jgi:cyanophycin synthetase
MLVRRVWNLSGPNVWARDPALEVWVDLGEFQGLRTDAIPGFSGRLLDWLPGLAQHPGPGGECGGFLESLRRGTTLAHVLERVVLELQTRAGNPVTFGRTQEAPRQPGVYQVVVGYEEPPVAEACLEVGRRLCLAAVSGEAFDLSGELQRLTDLADRNRLGLTTAAVVAAARKRNIPVEHLNPSDGRLVALGWGVHQRWLLAAQTDRTSDLGQLISQDKELTKSLLRVIGVPVPEGRPVKDAEDAWAAAQELGGPVVVKPRDRDLSMGVSINLTTREQVIAAFETARQKSEQVLVERFAPGFDHRVLVVAGKVVAVSRFQGVGVYGDGRSTIAQLVAQARIEIDQLAMEALASQGYTPESVPAAGMRVRLRCILDVTDRIHPAVAAHVIEAAKLLGLDVIGVDVVAEDISRPLEEQGGMILEINVGPAIWLHMAPWCHPPRPVAEAIVASVIPEGQDGRVPIIAVTGVNGKTTTTWLIRHIVRSSGRKLGMACTDGLFIEGRQISRRDCSGPHSARAVLRNPAVEVAVLETARGGILREGLGFDCCDVAVVTNIGEGDHLGLRGVETREDLARVKTTLVQAVSPRGFAVLNAADPLVAAMAEHCRGQVVYFARDSSGPSGPLLARHLAAGGRAVLVRDGCIVLAEGARAEPLIALDATPMTHGGRVGFQVENAMAAAAATWLLDVPRHAMRAGLASFVTSAQQAPGRFNVFALKDAVVIVDYAHNASALAALAEAVHNFPYQRKSIVYCACNRRDDDVIRQGEVLGASFDRVILYQDRGNSDRCDGELNALLRRGIAEGSRVREVVEYSGEIEAIEAALAGLCRGELLVVGAESIVEAVELVRKRLDSLGTPG